MKKKVFSGILAASLLMQVAVIPVSAEETTYYPYALFAANADTNSIQLNTPHLTVNGDMTTNGTFSSTAINPTLNSVITENANETLLLIGDKLENGYFSSNADTYAEDYTYSDVNVNVGTSIIADGDISLEGNISMNAGLMSLTDINIDGEVKNSNNTVLYAQAGDVNINSTNATINGLVYAPYGTVYINGQNVNINGSIIAQDIVIESDGININYNTNVAALIGTTPDAMPEPDDSDFIDIGEIYFKDITDNSEVANDGNGIDYVKNQFLLTACDGVSFDVVEDLAETYNGEIVGYIELTNDYQIEITQDVNSDYLYEVIDEVKALDYVEYAYLNTAFEVDGDFTPNDSQWASEEWSETNPAGLNWGVEAINAPSAWDYLNDMRKVKLGLIDCGFDLNHEDLNFVQEPYCFMKTAEEHGTHVAGIMAALFNNKKGIAGVCPTAKLYASDSHNNVYYMTSQKYKCELAYLIGNGVKAINISQNTGKSQAIGATNGNQSDINNISYNADIISRFLERMIDKNYDFIIVTSAGNWGYGTTFMAKYNSYLNCIENKKVKSRIITVASMDVNYSVSNFSNYGDRVDVIAPGGDIYSCMPNNNYGYMSGTSMATPHVTGTAGMLFAVNPSLNGAQVKTIIKNTTSQDIVDARTSTTYSYGLVDAYKAVKRAMTTRGSDSDVTNRANGIFTGEVKLNNNGVEDAQVTAYRLTTGDGNLDSYTTTATTDAAGQFELILPAGEYRVSVTAHGCVPKTLDETIIVKEQQTTYQSISMTAAGGTKVLSDVQGTVKDALDGVGLNGATIQFRNGWNNRDGEYVKNDYDQVISVISGENGAYTASLYTGTYTAEVSLDGYASQYVNIVSYSGCTQPQDIVLMPILSENEYRIVLTWQDEPHDLDSHLTGPTADGGEFHVYYSNKTYSENGEIVAKLDHDDITSYGPETVTTIVNADLNGVYRYSVHDYTNRASEFSYALSLSGAQVRVYTADGLVAEYYVPVNVEGTAWQVFEIVDGTISPVNSMYYVNSPSKVD